MQMGMASTCVSQCPPHVKGGFIRKVYSILTIQLLVTAASSALFMFHTGVQQWVMTNPSMLYTALFLPFGFIMALHCYKNSHPTNVWLLAGFTLCESYTVGFVCALYYQTGAGLIVLQALVLTAAVFVSLSTYVLVTKKDFSWLGGGLCAVLVVLIFWGFLNSFFPIPGAHMVFSLVGALLFAGYILYDTSQLIHNYGPDDYIVATISLYLDIINLFLYLLELLRYLQGGDN